MEYTYRAANAQGKIETGKDSADSREQLLLKLKANGKIPLEVKAVTTSLWNLPRYLWRNRLSPQERLNFTQQLGNLLESGVPLERALIILIRLTSHTEMSKVIHQLQRSLQEGLSFSTALANYSQHFPELYINMVQAGESGGVLPEVLTRLAQYLQEEIDLKRFIVSSLFYPMIVLAASIGAIFFYVGVVIPKFQSIFADIGSELPLITRMVMFVGNTVWNFWWVLVGLIVAGAVWFAREATMPQGRLWIDGLKLKIPLIGQILLKISTARMMMSLSLLCGSGIPLMEGLGIAKKVIGNEVLVQALAQVEQKVSQGNTVSKSMASQTLFPPLAVEMIGVGEESGTIVTMLDQVAKTYEREVKHALNLFLAVFEPLLILTMVGIIAILAVAILLPILNMNTQLNSVG